MSAPPTGYAGLAAAVRAAAPQLGATRLVCVDGPAGAGKTTFADRLVAALGGGVELVHMEDLYAGWTMTGALARLSAGVLRPVADGRPGGYRRFDWVAGRFADEPTPVSAATVLVVEGCGSGARRLDPWTTLRVWLEAPAPLCRARGLARDGGALAQQWEHWQAREAGVFAAERTRERADLRVDGAADPGPGRFAVLGPCTGRAAAAG